MARGVARVEAALRGAHRISLDTNVLIAAADPSDRRQPCAVWLLDEIEAGRFDCAISSVAAAEILVGALRAGVEKGLAAQGFLSRYPNMTIEPVTFEIAVDAAQVRALTRLRLPDSIIIATAIARGADALVHGDKEWRTKVGAYSSDVAFVDITDYCS